MDTYSYKISNDEFVYLTIHIKKLQKNEPWGVTGNAGNT